MEEWKGEEWKGRMGEEARGELKRISIDVDFEQPLRKRLEEHTNLVSKSPNTLFDLHPRAGVWLGQAGGGSKGL